MRTTIPSPFDPLNNDPGSLPRLAREFRAVSGDLQDLLPDCHKLHERLCDSVEALAPFAPLDFSLKNGLCYAIRTFLVRFDELKGPRNSGVVNWSFCFGTERLEASTDLDEEKFLVEDQELMEKLKYMDSLLTVYAERVLKASRQHIAETAKLVISRNVIGHGSHGTAVYEGHLGAQRVAVKRMLKPFYSVPQSEFNLARDAINHPNVLRYHELTEDSDFISVTMDYCSTTLADIVKQPQRHAEIAASFRPKEALQQMASGLQHLHKLGIVHGNIHPRNFLVSEKIGNNGKPFYQMVLSDYTLRLQLTVEETYERMSCIDSRDDQGWLAPEVLRGDVSLVDVPKDGDTRVQMEPVRAIDIFSLGCVFYYVLSKGDHPYGGHPYRESNILANKMVLEDVSKTHGLGQALIRRMLKSQALARPDAASCLAHPYFS